MKNCTKCGWAGKPSEFPLNKKGRGGLSPICFSCKRMSEKAVYDSNPHRKKNRGDGSPSRKFSTYKHSAVVKGKEFHITKDQFMELWQKPCYYCSASIQTIGIDRVNNERGYTVDNIVPCCKLCNYAKQGLSKAEFVALCMSVVDTHHKRESGKPSPEKKIQKQGEKLWS